jgi:hypothetical protein
MEDNKNPNLTQADPLSQEVQPADPLESQATLETEEDEPSSTPPGSSKKWYIIGAVLLVFLAAAVFLGARLIKSSFNVGLGGDSGPSFAIMRKGGGGGQAKSIRLNMTPAKELPKDKPSANGLFVRREDQSIFIGTGNVQMMFKKSSGSSSSSNDVSAKYDGPVVEVVVNHETKIYQDITEMMPPDSTNSGEVTIQQVVKPGSLDDLGQNSIVSVWGEKRGDRYIAKVITFR